MRSQELAAPSGKRLQFAVRMENGAVTERRPAPSEAQPAHPPAKSERRSPALRSIPLRRSAAQRRSPGQTTVEVRRSLMRRSHGDRRSVPLRRSPIRRAVPAVGGDIGGSKGEVPGPLVRKVPPGPGRARGLGPPHHRPAGPVIRKPMRSVPRAATRATQTVRKRGGGGTCGIEAPTTRPQLRVTGPGAIRSDSVLPHSGQQCTASTMAPNAGSTDLASSALAGSTSLSAW